MNLFRPATTFQEIKANPAYQSPLSTDDNSDIKTIVPACSASSMRIQVGQIIHENTHRASVVCPGVVSATLEVPASQPKVIRAKGSTAPAMKHDFTNRLRLVLRMIRCASVLVHESG
jgi:hypothetical protein